MTLVITNLLQKAPSELSANITQSNQLQVFPFFFELPIMETSVFLPHFGKAAIQTCQVISFTIKLEISFTTTLLGFLFPWSHAFLFFS